MDDLVTAIRNRVELKVLSSPIISNTLIVGGACPRLYVRSFTDLWVSTEMICERNAQHEHEERALRSENWRRFSPEIVRPAKVWGLLRK